MAEKIICGSDVMIDYFDVRQRRHTETKITIEEKIGLDNALLTAISQMELVAGALNKTELNAITKKLGRFDILLMDSSIIELAMTLLQTYKLSHGLLIPDSFIAATALIAELPLFTYNTKDFKFISKLKLYKA